MKKFITFLFTISLLTYNVSFSQEDLADADAVVSEMQEDTSSSAVDSVVEETTIQVIEEEEIQEVEEIKEEIEQKVSEVIAQVGLRDEHLRRYPHSFSGGQRQRIGIARSLIISPKVIICDEAVSALDVSVQAQVLNLLNQLKTEFNFTYIFISHDLSLVSSIADRVAVMYLGNLIEINSTEALKSYQIIELMKKSSKTKRIQVQIIPTNDGSLYPIPKMPSGCP